MTVGEALEAGRERLRSAGDDGRFDAQRLLEESLERSGAWILAHRDDVLTAPAATRYAAALERSARGEPTAYITGTAGFYGRAFAVNYDVLVPRPDSEHVVSLALEALRERERRRPLEPPRLCDVGTGSGILAIALACEWPTAIVTALDVSQAALDVALANARANRVAGRVRFLHSDLLAALPPGERFDCIVANLPYIRTSDLRGSPDPTSFEPRLALDGGPDGLDVYRRLIAEVEPRLTTDGSAFFEAGPDTTEALAALVRSAFPTVDTSVHRDYGGRDRVVALHRDSPRPTEKTDLP